MKKRSGKKSNSFPLLLLLPIAAVVIALPVLLTFLVNAPVGGRASQTDITASGSTLTDNPLNGGADGSDTNSSDASLNGTDSTNSSDASAGNADGLDSPGASAGNADGTTSSDAPADGTDSAQQGTSGSLSSNELANSWSQTFTLDDVPAYSGALYTVINNHIPFFSKTLDAAESFEYYTELDLLGRCGTACANIGQDIMPTEPRGEIGQVRPSGWHTVKYDGIDGNYLYNRSHLIAYQLSGENANVCNLITGTRSFNASGMLPFEEMVGNYVRDTGHHVLYRVTPMFRGSNLVADGVLMEAWSVEDQGEGICFNVFVYNVQPGIVIDYATGDSYADSGVYLADHDTSTQNGNTGSDTSANAGTQAGESGSSGNGGAAGSAPADTDNGMTTPAVQAPTDTPVPEPDTVNYILNTNTYKFHYPYCDSVQEMSERNKWAYSGTREEVTAMGYVPCKRCNP